MTDDNKAFNDNVDPSQSRQGRREALQFTLALYNSHKEFATAEDLIADAEKIDQYLEDGTVPPSE